MVHRSSSYSSYEYADNWLSNIVNAEGQKTAQQALNLFNGNQNLVNARLDYWTQQGWVKPTLEEGAFGIQGTYARLYTIQTITRNSKKYEIARDSSP